MKKALLIFLALSLFTSNASASTDQEVALKYLEVTKLKGILDFAIEATVSEIVAKNPKADRAIIKQRAEAIMGWETLKEPAVKLVLKAFTKDQLIEIIKLLETPAGRIYEEKIPWLSNELSKLINLNIEKAIQENKNK